VRWIVRECAQRDIEVIPEIQSLSHAYYLCLPHRDIAERADDPWPDTYCPSNPKSYELLFDVIDEVIEAVHPRIVHIGHDELYTLRVCPTCRRRPAYRLLADDITRIHGFLASRGIRTAMWGDKLMNIVAPDGRRYGGVAKRRRDPATGNTWLMPPTWRAADLVPKDILILDWYWSLDPRSERNFHRHGFDVIYGNLDPFRFRSFSRRAGVPYVLGAEVSTWCEVSPEAFGHNGVFHALFAGAEMLRGGTPMDPASLSASMARRMPALIDGLTGEKRWSASDGRGREAELDLSSAAAPLPGPLARLGALPRRAIVLDAANPTAGPIPVERKAARLLIQQATTMAGVYFRPTYYSYHRGPGELLEFLVEYADGKRQSFKAIYGDHIGPLEGRWPWAAEGRCYQAVPTLIGGKRALYTQEWANPRPGAPIASISVRLGADARPEGQVLITSIVRV